MAIDLSSLSNATSLTKGMTGSENSSTWGTTFSTPQGDYLFISEDAINKGVKEGDTVSWLPWFLNKNNLATLNQAGQYVDLSNVKASGITSKDTWGNWVQDRLGQSPKGFIIPAGIIDPTSAGISTDNVNRLGNISGIAQDSSGNLVYKTTGGHGNMYATATGEVHDPYIERKGGFLGSLVGGISDVLQGLGPITPIVLNAIAPGAGTGYAVGTAIGSGADIGDILKSVAINQGLSAAIGAAGATGAEVPVDLNEATAGFQNVYGGQLPIEDIQTAFDVTSPLADTTATLDTSFLQDMDQGIQPEVNLEGGNLGMTEAEAQNQYYESIGLNPETVVDTPAVPTTGDTPEIPSEPTTPNLTPQQISQLLKIGAGLFGGGGALAMAAKGLTGGIPNTAATMPTVQAPTPFTGTYSGMNPYDAAYFQQVQQNYNRLFPTAPTNVATPLQSWYQTQYKPDTTISNKLFGV